MSTSNRFFIDLDPLGLASIVDGLTGNAVFEEPALSSGCIDDEGNSTPRASDELRTRCKAMNDQDYSERRQYGEPRAAWVERLIAAGETWRLFA